MIMICFYGEYWTGLLYISLSITCVLGKISLPALDQTELINSTLETT